MAEPASDLRSPSAGNVRRIGRYDLHEEIASGGMATVYLGRLVGATGFSRPVAVKRLHDNLATDPKFVSMLLDEARLAARVRHPNVVATLDVVEAEREVVVVMEYVHGESLAVLRKIAADRGERIPPRIAAAIIAGALHGLHAAHEAVDEQGEPLHIVHRDVSPQNILVGVDGSARVLDFGIAKAAGRMQTTQDGKLKGKFGYMAPEQLKAAEITGQADVYAASVVLWEMLTGRRLHPEDADAATILTKALFEEVKKPSELAPDLPEGADEVVLRGLAKDPAERYPTALAMAADVERVFGVASAVEVAAYVKDIAKEAIQRKSETLAIVERADTDAGQKQRREVVARVASGNTDAGQGHRARNWGIAVAGVLVAGAVAWGLSRPTTPPTTSTTTSTTTSSTTTPTASPTTPPVANLNATTAPSAAADASAESALAPASAPAIVSGAPAAPVLSAGKGKKLPPAPPIKKPEIKPEPTTPVVVKPAEPDAAQDLIPKFRK